jgi:2-polyprenyl-6-methoxyphenol hydroxylase-like FAD-dependent oxidoreductase
VARLESGREERGHVLIGADGIGSVVRAQLLADGPPRYAGYAGWRAVVHAPPGLVSPGTFSESWGRGVRFGIVDIGGRRIYWFVSETCREGSWERGGIKSEFVQRFRGWHPPVEALLDATPEGAITATGIYDRPPARRWGAGRITLLGDAAHPMTPNIGQGACQALEDAVVLGRCLADAPGAEGLREYERLRIPRTSALVRRSRQLGALAQASKPPLTFLRDTLVRAIPDRVQRAQQRQVLQVDL